MVLILSLLFISSVFEIGRCQTNPVDAKKALEDQVKEVQFKIKTTNEENEHLLKEIEDEKKKFATIAADKDIAKNGTAENKKQAKELEDLYKHLLKVQLEVKELKEAPLNIDKIKLEIQVLNENIKTLDNRRKNGVTNQCMELVGMAGNSSNRQAILLVLPQFTVEDTIVLEDELRKAETILHEVTYRRDELKKELKDLRDLYEIQRANLNDLLQKISSDKKKGQESIDKIKKAIEENNKKKDELSKTLGKTKDDLENQKKEFKKVYEKYKSYAIEMECFRKLYNEVYFMVYPKP